MTKDITQEELKALFTYEPETGLFVRATQLPGSNYKVGTIAGSIDKGYVVIRIRKHSYMAHRLAFLFMRGYLPTEVDHTNHNKRDNRWENLIEVTHAENMKNKKLYKSNSSGVVGVSWAKKACRWRAIITVDKKQMSLGMFVEFSDAVNARKNAEVLYNFHVNHGGIYE